MATCVVCNEEFDAPTEDDFWCSQDCAIKQIGINHLDLRRNNVMVLRYLERHIG